MYTGQLELTLAMWLNNHDGVRSAIVAFIVLTFIAFALYPERRTVPRVTSYTPERRGGPWGGKVVKIDGGRT